MFKQKVITIIIIIIIIIIIKPSKKFNYIHEHAYRLIFLSYVHGFTILINDMTDAIFSSIGGHADRMIDARKAKI